MTEIDFQKEIINVLTDPFAEFDLTEKEEEASILAGVYGLTMKEIGYKLGISKQGVYNRLVSASGKIGLISSKDLSRFVLQKIREVVGVDGDNP